MDDIQKRLEDTSAQIIKAFQVWGARKNDTNAREVLMEAVHELRKVSSRIEIEVAISEREEVTQHPIPIPSHRASQPRGPESGDEPRDSNRGGGRDRGHGDMRRRMGPGRGPRPVGQESSGDENRGNF
jgi:hypothetical protein